MLTKILEFTVLKLFRLLQFSSKLIGFFGRYRKHVPCPPITNDILLIPAVELVKEIRQRKISSESVIRAYISRIKSVNPVLNAVVDDRFDDAIQEAIKVDDLIANTELNEDELAQKHPLLGLPVTVKESIAVKGLSFAAGKVFPGGKIAERDAEIVRKIKEAGGIVLAVTNTPELCANVESYNKVTGRTYNPYDTRRTCGGSSGGEAALLGAGASLLGIGSDLLGSVRLPALFCGVFGHKPSSYSVSIDGHYPDCKQKKLLEEVFILGPMVRYAIDLKFFLDVLLKNEKRTLIQLNKNVPLKNIKIFIPNLDNMPPQVTEVDEEVNLAVQKFANHMQSKYDCKVEKIDIKRFKTGFQLVGLKVMGLEFEGVSKDEQAYWELLKYIFGQSDQVISAIIPGIIHHVYQKLPKSMLINAEKMLAQLKEQIETILGDDGILALPCHNTPAHYHGTFIGKLFNFGYTGIFSTTGLPAVSCPMGLNSEGLPIGIQIAASFNNDKLCLAVAEEIEKEFKGWISPQFQQ